MDVKAAGLKMAARKEKLGMTRKELSQRSGVTEYAIERYMTGEVINVQQEVVELICKALGMRVLSVDPTEPKMGTCQNCGKKFKKATPNMKFCTKWCCTHKHMEISREKRIMELDKKNDLNDIALLAEQKGMTYGKYVSLYQV